MMSKLLLIPYPSTMVSPRISLRFRSSAWLRAKSADFEEASDGLYQSQAGLQPAAPGYLGMGV